MVGAISLRRSRGAFQSGFIPQSRSMCRAWYLVLAVAACSAPKVPLGDPQAEIAAMLVRSAADWNRGDLTGFMGDYARDSMTSRSEEHTSELQSPCNLVCRLLLEKKKKDYKQ